MVEQVETKRGSLRCGGPRDVSPREDSLFGPQISQTCKKYRTALDFWYK